MCRWTRLSRLVCVWSGDCWVPVPVNIARFPSPWSLWRPLLLKVSLEPTIQHLRLIKPVETNKSSCKRLFLITVRLYFLFFLFLSYSMKCAGGVEVYPTLRYRTETIKPAAVNGLGRQNTTFTYIQYIVFSFFLRLLDWRGIPVPDKRKGWILVYDDIRQCRKQCCGAGRSRNFLVGAGVKVRLHIR